MLPMSTAEKPRSVGDIPSASSFEAFCSDMPFICSSARRGLLGIKGGFIPHLFPNLRVSNGLHCVITALYYQLDIARSQSVDTLNAG